MPRFEEMSMALPMSLQQLTEANPVPELEQDPQHWRWTIDTYFRAAELGLFDRYRKVELIDGEIYAHVSPIGSRHSAAISMLDSTFRELFGRKYSVRWQMPILRSDDSMPESDISVVPPRKTIMRPPIRVRPRSSLLSKCRTPLSHSIVRPRPHIMERRILPNTGLSIWSTINSKSIGNPIRRSATAKSPSITGMNW